MRPPKVSGKLGTDGAVEAVVSKVSDCKVVTALLR